MKKEKDELSEFSEQIERGLKISFEKLIAFKKYKDTPFVFQRNGKIVKLTAEEVERELIAQKSKPYIKRKDSAHYINEPSEKSQSKKSKE